MDFRVDGEARKMHHWSCVVAVLFLGYTIGAQLDDNNCYMFRNSEYPARSQLAKMEYGRAEGHSSCSVDDLSDNVQIKVGLSEDGSISSGLAVAKFTLPDVNCCYKIALLENSLITNGEDCQNNVFHESNAYSNETHSTEETVCASPSLNRSSAHNCQNEVLSMWYKHVFSGCYAVRFNVGGDKYSVLGSRFLTTHYNRTEVVKPMFQCYYEDRLDPELGNELVRFVLRISVASSIARMRLTLAPRSEGNACLVYTENLYTWEISTSDPESSNCSDYGDNANPRKIYCNWLVPVSRKVNYCFRISLLDGRCDSGTIWNPAVEESGGVLSACSWIASCAMNPMNASAVEQNRSSDANSEHVLVLPIAITVILIVLVLAGSIFVYRLHSRHARQRVYVNTNLRDRAVAEYRTELESVETTDDETVKGSNNGDESDAIILLYARGSPSFMSLMSELREIFKNYCGCHVQDWYSASEWDAVARVGPSAWVADLLRKKHRAVWIDTPRARALIDTQGRKNHSSELKRPYERCLDEEAVSDFRDIALPSVLDLAKRNITPEPALQYTRHFVVRLEGLDTAPNRNEDPFEDLSPHTRYLIPHHLTDLCSHISSWRNSVDAQRLKTEEAQLRERLIRMKATNS